MSGRRRAGMVLGTGLVLIVALLSVVWRQSVGVTLDAEISRLQAAYAAERAELDRIEDELRRVERRSRIVRYARDSLQMRMPHDHEVLLLPLSPAPRAAEVGW